MTCAMCRARRPVFASSICVVQEKPLATMAVPSPASRTAGSSACSPQSIEMPYLPFSNPQDPARPQQPPLRLSVSSPICSRTFCSGSMPPVARWWQCPHSSALPPPGSSGGRMP
ncbi:Uncharacterised protein [Mycobacterium tuberculosis]|nr:Uncharacterised protein [Mycobacterium tuberculosis]